MATPTLGQLQPFNSDTDSITAYIERVHLFFAANDIPDKKKVPVFLSTIGGSTYELLRNLVSPELPESLKLSELTEVLKRHFEPKPLVIAERFHFHSRSQAADESVADFMAQLRRLSKHCDFQDYLDQALRDRLVCGLRNEGIQRRLLAESDLTLTRALELAQGMEAAEKNAKSLKGTVPAVHNVNTGVKRPPVQSTCHRCGRTNHEAKDCRFRDAVCHFCNKKGHIAPVCRSKKQSKSKHFPKQKSRPTKYVTTDGETTDANLPISTIGKSASRPFRTNVLVNGKAISMEIDTGAALSIMSERQQKLLLPDAPIEKSYVRLKTYTGENMPVVGKLNAKVQYGEQSKDLDLVVVAGDGPTLLGRNWLKTLRLDWATIGKIATEKAPLKLSSLLASCSVLFKDELGKITPFKAKLHVRVDAVPKFCKARSVPYATKQAIEKELDRLEASGILKKITYSEWAAPIVAVPKKDGQIRICGDYKVTINQAIEVDQYPLPKPDDLFASLAGGNKFTTLDLSQAYLQLQLDEESAHLTTVNTHRGLYQYTRLPFGVSSAPALFQKTMDTILQGIPNVICYIDDILVTGSNDEEHLKNLAEVLDRLEKHGVRIKKTKCRFMQESVEFLGHRIDAEGLHATQEKLESIVEAPEPNNVQELRSFLGLLNYYGKFVPNLSTLLHPLNRLLRLEQQWEWSADCTNAFQQAKDALTSSELLTHYDPALPLRLAADASNYGLGAVISHIMSNGDERPIAYASRTLSKSEQNYAQIEKEALALIFGIKKFHQYLFGRKFTLITDHKPLMAILGPKKSIPSMAAARLQRWAVLLSAYDYQLEFRPSQSHSNADGLSRLPLPTVKPVAYSEEPTLFNISQIEALPVTSQSIRQATKKDALLSKVFQYTKYGWPRQVPGELCPFSSRQRELSIEDDCLLWGIRVVIPESLQPQLLQEIHRDHPGISRMKSLARSHVWWPGIDQDIEKVAKSCESCLAVKQAPPSAPLQPWTWPSRPWQRVHIDFAGPFLNKMYFIAVDAHSKWPEVFEMNQTTTSNTITVLRNLFARYGLPEQIVSDNGPQFISDEFTQFLHRNRIKHTRSSPYHPSTNGAVERFVRTFKQAMKAGNQDGLLLQHRLANFLITYRSTPHATTQVSPCTLFLGRNIRTRLDLVHPDIAKRVCEKQSQQKESHDQHARERDFALGQIVMVRNYRSGPAWVKGTISEQRGPLTFMVTVNDGQLWKRHVDQIKHFQQKTSTEFDTPENADSMFSDAPANPPAYSSEEPAPLDLNNPAGTQTSQLPSETTRYPKRNRHPPDMYGQVVRTSYFSKGGV